MQNDLKARWQKQPVEGGRMSLEEVRVQAERFERRMRRTYNREFLAAIITILWMGAYVWFLKPVPLRVAAGLSIPAILLMLYQLRKKVSPRTLPQALGLISSVEFLRTQLERQRDARQNIWRWYLRPFVPVALVWAIAFYFLPRVGLVLSLMVGAFFALDFLVIARLNQRAARRLQGQIDELER
jgi:hypothetical protein